MVKPKHILFVPLAVMAVYILVSFVHLKQSTNNDAAALKATATTSKTDPNTITGTLTVYHTDTIKGKTYSAEHFAYVTTSTGEKVYLTADKIDSLDEKDGATVSIQGTRQGDHIVVTTVDDIQVTKQPPVAQGPIQGGGGNAHGIRHVKVAVILFNFTDNTSQTRSPADEKNVIFGDTPQLSANNFYKDMSHGQIQLEGKLDVTGDVFGWYTVSMNQGVCGSGGSGLASTAAASDGFIASNYDVIIYNFPSSSVGCGWSGITNQKTIWVDGAYTPIYNHEIGHALGLQHAHAYDCSDNGQRTAFSGVCNKIEYGDRFDSMGGVDGPFFSNAYKDKIGLISTQNLIDVGSSGVFDIYTSNNFSRVNTLRIPLFSNAAQYPFSGDYYLELRKRISWDNFFNGTDPVVNGVTLRYTTNRYNNNFTYRSYLIDTKPQTVTYQDAPILPGETFTDNINNITIHVLSVVNNKATVQITKGLSGNCSFNQVNFSLTQLYQTGNLGETKAYPFQFTNPSSCPPMTFSLTVIPTLEQYGFITNISSFASVVVPSGQTYHGILTIKAPNASYAHVINYNLTLKASLPPLFSNILLSNQIVSFDLLNSSPCAYSQPTLVASQAQGVQGASVKMDYIFTDNNLPGCGITQWNVSPVTPSGWYGHKFSIFSTSGGQQVDSSTYSPIDFNLPQNTNPAVYLIPVNSETVLGTYFYYPNIATWQVRVLPGPIQGGTGSSQ